MKNTLEKAFKKHAWPGKDGASIRKVLLLCNCQPRQVPSVIAGAFTQQNDHWEKRKHNIVCPYFLIVKLNTNFQILPFASPHYLLFKLVPLGVVCLVIFKMWYWVFSSLRKSQGKYVLVRTRSKHVFFFPINIGNDYSAAPQLSVTQFPSVLLVHQPRHRNATSALDCSYRFHLQLTCPYSGQQEGEKGRGGCPHSPIWRHCSAEVLTTPTQMLLPRT